MDLGSDLLNTIIEFYDPLISIHNLDFNVEDALLEFNSDIFQVPEVVV